jgi:peptidoglycan glycosyltransferase
MNTVIDLLAGSWVALGLLKSSAIALIGGTFIFCLRQRDLAAGLWAGLSLLLPLAFFSGQLSLSWKALPLVVDAPAQATPGTNFHPQMATTPATQTEMPGETNGESVSFTMETAAPLATTTEIAPSRSTVSREHWLLGLWIAGGAATLFPGLLTLIASRRLHRYAAPEEITAQWNAVAGQHSKSVQVWISPDVTTPGITSALRPQIVLPESALLWKTDRLISVLRHELHHLARHDLAQRWLGRVARAVLWFHPAAWWVQSRLVLAQERAADEAVVAAGVPAADYAGHLLETAAESRLFPGIAMARRSQVGGRIHLLLTRRERAGHVRTAAERAAAALMVGLAMILAVLGFSSPEAAGAEEPANPLDNGFRAPILDRNGKLIATSDPARMPEKLRANPPLRWYPEGAALGHVSGFVSPLDGEVEVVKSSGLEDRKELALGKAVTTTIDVGIQRLAWEELAASRLPGSVIVMDPLTGEVLAMASWPSIDPNEYADGVRPDELLMWQSDDRRPLRNRALAVEAPGSFAKLITALGAASNGLHKKSFFCGPTFKTDGVKVLDIHPLNEEVGLHKALVKSSNIYFSKLAIELGHQRLHNVWGTITMQRSDDSQWPMSAARWCPLNADVVPSDFPSWVLEAFGSGTGGISLLDSAAIMSTVASGVVREPSFVVGDKVRDPVPLKLRGVDPLGLDLIKSGLVDCVNSRGTGTGAKLENILVAGIPATVRLKRRDGGGYSQDYLASFTGYAPADKPRYVVAVRMEGRNAGQKPFYGGAVAAPVAARLFQALLADEK